REHGPWITNPTFTAAPLDSGFDWHTPQVEGVSMRWRHSPGSLQIDFSGRQPEECEVLRQDIPVHPLQSYLLKADYTLAEIEAGTGLNIRLTDSEKGTEIAFALLDGKPAQLIFRAPETTSVLRLSLAYRRMPGATRIEGSIRIAGFYLEARR